MRFRDRSRVRINPAPLPLHLGGVCQDSSANPAPRKADGEQAVSRWGAGDAFAARGVFALAAVIFFFHLGSYGLWEPDEARYAEIAREMLALGEWIVPHLNYVAYVEKPPLLYWITAASMWAFGLNEFAARMVPAVSALAGVVMTFFFVHRTFDRRRAILAAAILATAPLYAIMAQVLITDMLLTMLVTGAVFAMFMHWREGGSWCWFGYLAMALATLTKGPVGIVLPALSLAVFLWWEGELRGSIRRFHAIAGLALVMAIAAPWFVAISLREPGFADFYFVGEHLRRALQGSYSHGEPFYYYIPVLIGGLIPWSLMVPFLTWRGMAPNPARRFCLITAIVIVVVFSLASAKLIPYVLPAFAPLAVVIADGVASCAWPEERGYVTLPRPDSRILIESGPMLAVLGLCVAGVAAAAPMLRTPYPMAARSATFAIGAILVAGGVAAALVFARRAAAAGLTLIVLTLALALCAGTWARLQAEPLRSYARLSKRVAELAPGATLICYHRYVQALPFYTHRRVILVGPRSELEFGAERSPDREEFFLNTDEDLLRLWNSAGLKVLVLDEPDLDRLRDRLGLFTLIAKEHTKRAIEIRRGELASN